MLPNPARVHAVSASESWLTSKHCMMCQHDIVSWCLAECTEKMLVLAWVIAVYFFFRELFDL